MSEKTTYFVLKEKAVPEVLRKVVEAKRLIESGRCISVQDWRQIAWGSAGVLSISTKRIFSPFMTTSKERRSLW